MWLAYCPSSFNGMFYPFLANLKCHLHFMFKCPCIYGLISGNSVQSHWSCCLFQFYTNYCTSLFFNRGILALGVGQFCPGLDRPAHYRYFSIPDPVLALSASRTVPTSHCYIWKCPHHLQRHPRRAGLPAVENYHYSCLMWLNIWRSKPFPCFLILLLHDLFPFCCADRNGIHSRMLCRAPLELGLPSTKAAHSFGGRGALAVRNYCLTLSWRWSPCDVLPPQGPTEHKSLLLGQPFIDLREQTFPFHLTSSLQTHKRSNFCSLQCSRTWLQWQAAWCVWVWVGHTGWNSCSPTDWLCDSGKVT